MLGSGDDIDVSMLVSKKIVIEGSIEDLLDGNVEIQLFNLLYKVSPVVDNMSSAHPLARVDRLRSRCSSYHDRKLQNSSRKLNSRTSNTTSTIDLVEHVLSANFSISSDAMYSRSKYPPALQA